MAEITAVSTDDFQVVTTDSEEVARESLEEPEKPADDVEQKAVDGRERDEKGKFAVKPIPPEKLEAKKPEKPKEGAKPAEPKTEGINEEKKPKTPEEKEAAQLERSKAQLRVEQATHEASHYRNELKKAQKQLEAIQAQAPQQKPTPRPQFQATEDDPEPVLGEGVDPVEWVKGRTDWAARQAVRDAERRQSEQQQAMYRQAQIEQLKTDYRTAAEKFSEKDPDFMERVAPWIRDLKPSYMLSPTEKADAYNGIADRISTSSRAPEMMLYLTEHPEEFQRLATLIPDRQTWEMAKIEARLDPISVGTPESKPPYIPKARGPVTPATGGPTATDAELDPETTDPDTWVRVMNERDRKAGRL